MATEKIRVGIIGASMRNGWGRDAHIPAFGHRDPSDSLATPRRKKTHHLQGETHA